MDRHIYIATVEHMSGMDHFADTTEDGLYRQLADYCRSHWETCDEPGITDVMEDDRKCVEHYFNDHENDSLTESVCLVAGLGLPERDAPSSGLPTSGASATASSAQSPTREGAGSTTGSTSKA